MSRPNPRVQAPVVHPVPVGSPILHHDPDPDRSLDHVLDLTRQVPTRAPVAVAAAAAVAVVAAVQVVVRVTVVRVRSECV
jgi:hypothetical protein